MHKKLTPKKRAEFLEWLACSCNISYAARKISVSREALYKLRRRDEYFAQLWDKAKEIGFDGLEDEMRRRAFIGDVRYTKNGEVRIYSDRLAIFLAKAHRPAKYKSHSQVELAHGPLPSQINDPGLMLKLNSVLKNALISINQEG